MATSLYDLTVGSYSQILEAALSFMEKGKSHCEENGIALSEIVDTSLHLSLIHI